MKTNIRKWGNSAGTIIPVPMLEAAGIALGDKVNIEAKAGTLVMTLVDEPMTLEDLQRHTTDGIRNGRNDRKASMVIK